MNIQILTSSYPAHPADPGGTAGLFVRDFALGLISQGHKVIIQPVARSDHYEADKGLIIEPLPWKGGDQELASLNFFSPRSWLLAADLFSNGRKAVSAAHEKYRFDFSLCMWTIPSGIFGFWLKKKHSVPYSIWALGSDIWKISKIPVLGKYLLKKIITEAKFVCADGIGLSEDVRRISGRECVFLPSSRKLPAAKPFSNPQLPPGRRHLLFVGRYHKNKGPDLLIQAVSHLTKDVRNKIFVHMYGMGPLRDDLLKLVEDLGLKDCVKINGPLETADMVSLLQKVEFLLIPSRIESIPLVFSDALSNNVPVVVMPVGDLPQLVSKWQCGETASAVDPLAYSEALTHALSRGTEFYKKGVAAAKNSFNIEDSIHRWLNKIAES